MDRLTELLESCRAQNARLIEDNKRLRAELAALRAERDGAEARAEAAQDECEYAQDLVIRQGNMLRAVVNALRGPPPEDMLWSVHDAQELAAAMRARAERAEAEAARLRAAIESECSAELFEDGLSADLRGSTLPQAYMAGRTDVLDELRAALAQEGV